MSCEKLFSEQDKSEVEQWFSGQGEKILKKLGIKPDDHVLDFGCGIGSYAVPLVRITGKNGSVTIVDKEPEKLAVTRQQCTTRAPHCRLHLVCNGGDESLAMFKDNSFDSALVFDVLQHVNNWDTFFTGLARVLSPESRLLINPSIISHPGNVDAAKLLSALHRHGIKIITRFTSRIMHFKRFAEDEIWICQT